MTTPKDIAPETHNSEQDDAQSQAQTVSADAQAKQNASPTESIKVGDSGVMGDSTQDLVDHMRDMESSGRIDMGAFKGEPNMDDNAGKFGKGHDAEFEGDDS
ncbi:hypothetical protein [Qipengyuania marisflavi]|uniref:Uncharacterized protein n=1 Tax=Qipengyuania marisflavi TaxID=2486356 RepID=A0A5S3PAG7_9SPHN|nr:hypothetical protein [Qipengyuania marisflavi]TMM48038.1 hypothetical protein FEV51_06945 [Qipengyuania marisflavi]